MRELRESWVPGFSRIAQHLEAFNKWPKGQRACEHYLRQSLGRGRGLSSGPFGGREFAHRSHGMKGILTSAFNYVARTREGDLLRRVIWGTGGIVFARHARKGQRLGIFLPCLVMDC